MTISSAGLSARVWKWGIPSTHIWLDPCTNGWKPCHPAEEMPQVECDRGDDTMLHGLCLGDERRHKNNQCQFADRNVQLESYTSFAEFLVTPKKKRSTNRALQRLHDYRDVSYWDLKEHRRQEWDEYQCYLKMLAEQKRIKGKKGQPTRKLPITGVKSHLINMGPVVQVVEPDSNGQTKGHTNKGHTKGPLEQKSRKKGMWMPCIVL